MQRPLFVYGTLRDPDLLAAVLGRPLAACEILAAVAPGFRAAHYPNRIYPALIRAPGAAAARPVTGRPTTPTNRSGSRKVP